MKIRSINLRYWSWIGLCAAAIFVAVKAIPYVTTDTSFFDPIFRDKYARHLAVVLTHGAVSIVALTLGPFQFLFPQSPAARRWHRRLGYTYLSCVAIGSITGFYMALIAFGGPSSKIAFACFAIGWFATGALALSAAKNRDFIAHRNWMIRNFALTFGAATLRIYLNILQGVGFDFVTIYPYMAWLSWIPNILAAEFILHSRKMNPILNRN